MGGGGGSLDSGEPEFQIAPMIDVLLVMLIFFMTITSSQVLRVDKDITLPVAPNSIKKANARAEALINVGWNEQTKRKNINFEDVDYQEMDKLVDMLKKRRNDDVKYRAVIRADKKVPARYISEVMGACAEAGISDIAFAVSNKESA